MENKSIIHFCCSLLHHLEFPLSGSFYASFKFEDRNLFILFWKNSIKVDLKSKVGGSSSGGASICRKDHWEWMFCQCICSCKQFGQHICTIRSFRQRAAECQTNLENILRNFQFFWCFRTEKKLLFFLLGISLSKLINGSRAAILVNFHFPSQKIFSLNWLNELWNCWLLMKVSFCTKKEGPTLG